MLYYIIVFYIIFIILYYIILYYIILCLLYYIILYHIMFIILYYIILYYIILYFIAIFKIALKNALSPEKYSQRAMGYRSIEGPRCIGDASASLWRWFNISTGNR